jgi:hypothetical protein
MVYVSADTMDALRELSLRLTRADPRRRRVTLGDAVARAVREMVDRAVADQEPSRTRAI